MISIQLPADQASLRVYTSREPEDPEFTVDSLLPFLGLGAIECDINSYVLPMHTSLQTYVCPALESAECGIQVGGVGHHPGRHKKAALAHL